MWNKWKFQFKVSRSLVDLDNFHSIEIRPVSMSWKKRKEKKVLKENFWKNEFFVNFTVVWCGVPNRWIQSQHEQRRPIENGLEKCWRSTAQYRTHCSSHKLWKKGVRSSNKHSSRGTLENPRTQISVLGGLQL